MLKPMSLLFSAGALGLLLSACATGPSVDRSNWYDEIVDRDVVKQYAVTPQPEGVAIIDSRPARRYEPGHIPTAINIPDTQFDRHADLLPEDRSTLLIFYCGGVQCPLSHQSARRAEELGYENIKVYAKGMPDWKEAGELVAVGADHMRNLIESGDQTLIVDSRPTKRKYDLGHLPTAINIPDSRFDSMTHLLPADKDTPVIFYCDGYRCPLSANSAQKAMDMGYTDVKTFAAGYPRWVEAFGDEDVAVAGAGSAGELQQGPDEGIISVAAFERLLEEGSNPAPLIVDVRTPDEAANGTLPGAINIPIGDLEDKLDTLPRNRPVIFFCSTGGRSGEAYDMAVLLTEGVDAYFVDAAVTILADGSYNVE